MLLNPTIDRLAMLKAAVDDGLRTRRYLDYWGSSAWARDAAPVVDALAEEVATAPSAELVLLLQRAVRSSSSPRRAGSHVAAVA